jgi:restriction endonuclease S subunit
MKLSDLCEIKTNFSDADFWLQRKGSVDTVGTPTKEFNPENIGIKVIRTNILIPEFLYYTLIYYQSVGYFSNISKGTINLKNIRVEDIKEMRLS